MLYYLFSYFQKDIHVFNVFRYLTFRCFAAILTALLISFLCGSRFIRWLKERQGEGQPIREVGPSSHLITKKGTPTMGGTLILFSLSFSSLLWFDLSNPYVWTLLLVTLGFGFLGGVDDYKKLTKRNSKGISGKVKLAGQIFLSLLAISITVWLSPTTFATSLTIPFFKDVLIPLGPLYYLVAIFVIVGASNAVNLTDGLDGLAIVPVMIASTCFALIAYLVGNSVFANYLQLLYIPHVGELSVFCGALIGAGLGFLWFNAPPAKVFMGDTGSLAAGGALGIISVMTKHEIVLGIIGGVFVIEALSVIIQVLYFKWSKGKRVFLMAPIHHHFEKKGWSEATVVIRFWIIATVLALIGLSTLKLR